jgi:glycosyltransferase involved in cell wall biosynthesis
LPPIDFGKKSMKILTITSNDIGISYGPAIHYLELWNEVAVLDPALEIVGIAPSWTGKKPIAEPKFRLHSISVPALGLLRQLVYDFFVGMALPFLVGRYDAIYIRVSNWHFFQIIALYFSRAKYIVELNGLALDDAKSARRGRVRTYLFESQERWLINNAALSICVSDGIERTVKRRCEPRGQVVTIPNGVASAFFDSTRSERVGLVPIKIAYVGTFTAWDGAAQIVQMASYFPDVKFLMVGDGAGKADLEAAAPANVDFLGRLEYNALPEFYQKVDAGIVLYEFERHRNVKASSLKTLEYVASGLPVFSTAINGQQFIEEYGVGLLLQENESLTEKFSTFLTQLGNYRAKHAELGARLRDVHGWTGVAKKTVEHIRVQRFRLASLKQFM